MNIYGVGEITFALPCAITGSRVSILKGGPQARAPIAVVEFDGVSFRSDVTPLCFHLLAKPSRSTCDIDCKY